MGKKLNKQYSEFCHIMQTSHFSAETQKKRGNDLNLDEHKQGYAVRILLSKQRKSF